MVSVQEIISYLESYFPKKLAYDWDNVGLQIGSSSAKVDSILICVDITKEVIDEAKCIGAQLVISHHPLIFQGLKSIKDDSPDGALIIDIIKNNINIYCMHTNADVSRHGINYYLAKLIGLENVEGLSFKYKNQFYKIVVYVPNDYKEMVLEAMAKEGAGFIGNYSHCFFGTEGDGVFKPLDGSNPFIGEIGKIQRVKEVRLESIVPEENLKSVIRSMLKAHPYEEVAYDIYRLENDISFDALGVIGQKKVLADEIIKELKAKLNLSYLRALLTRDQFKKIAIVSGSGKDLIKDAYFKGADCLITGEVGHHGAILAKSLNLSLLELGHFESEKVFIEIIYDLLESFEKRQGLKVYKSALNTDYMRLY